MSIVEKCDNPVWGSCASQALVLDRAGKYLCDARRGAGWRAKSWYFTAPTGAIGPGIRLANFILTRLLARGEDAELIDAQAVGLPMLDRMYKEHAPGTAPAAMTALAGKIRAADAFIFVTGEYNWGIQPGLKNLTDHFLEEWFWRPAAIASYSAGRLSGVRAATAWHGILSEMGMVVISSTLAVGPIRQPLDEDAKPIGAAGAALEKAFPRFADDLAWWTGAARSQRARQAPPY